MASVARPKTVSATPSLTGLSPGRMLTMGVGAPTRFSTDVAATASVGDTAAANARAAAQPAAGSSAWVTAPTAMIVIVVAPKASAVIGTAFSLVSRGAVRKAAL